MENTMLSFKLVRPKYIKQEPYIDNDGVWEPCEPYVSEGCASKYRLVMSKDMFVEEYNKWIKGEES